MDCIHKEKSEPIWGHILQSVVVIHRTLIEATAIELWCLDFHPPHPPALVSAASLNSPCICLRKADARKKRRESNEIPLSISLFPPLFVMFIMEGGQPLFNRFLNFPFISDYGQISCSKQAVIKIT